MVRRDRRDRVEVGGLAVQMGRQDRFGPVRDRRLDPRRVEVMRRGIGFDRHRGRTRHRHRQLGRDIAVAGDDHLVPRPDPDRLQRQVQRIESVADPDCMARATISRPLRLERRDFRSADIRARCDHSRHSGVDFHLEFAGCGGEVEERDHGFAIAINSS